MLLVVCAVTMRCARIVLLFCCVVCQLCLYVYVGARDVCVFFFYRLRRNWRRLVTETYLSGAMAFGSGNVGNLLIYLSEIEAIRNQWYDNWWSVWTARGLNGKFPRENVHIYMKPRIIYVSIFFEVLVAIALESSSKWTTRSTSSS